MFLAGKECGDSVIPGTLNGLSSLVESVGVDHGGADVLVSQEFLDGADVAAGLQEVGGEVFSIR